MNSSEAPQANKTTKNSLFIFDTSFLLDGAQADVFDKWLGPLLFDKKIRSAIPTAVLNELKKMRHGNDPKLTQAAIDAEAFLRQLQKLGLLEIVGEEEDSFADGVFRYACAQLQLKYHLLFLTQDVGLMHDILMLNESTAVTRGLYTISMLTLDQRDGKIKETDLAEVRKRLERRAARQAQSGAVSQTQGPKTPKHSTEVYTRPGVTYVQTNELRPDGTTIDIPESEIPDCGSTVNAGRFGTFQLGAEIARGGEGRIYLAHNEDYVAKIYKLGKLTDRRSKKIDAMIEKGLDWDHPLSGSYTWPVEKIIDMKGRPVGFMMKRVDGEILANTVFIGRRLRNRFPDWDRTHLVRLCIAIVQRIRFLHDSNVIIGDINPQNLVIRSCDDLSFIDTDSYQVEGYPCTVGTVRFTPPELLGERFGTTVLTQDHEIYSVATLLFMILHAGKPPYAQTDGSTPIDNIQSGNFPYSFDGSGSQNVPEGPWKYIWSNLTYKVKQLFYETFSAEHRESLRTPLTRWQGVLEEYLSILENKCGREDQRRALFPAYYKKGTQYSKQKECIECGRDFSLSEDALTYYHTQGWDEPTRCYDCRAKRRELADQVEKERQERQEKMQAEREAERRRKDQIAESRQCVNCRSTFQMTVGEVESFRRKGLNLPKRCKSCRGIRQRW